MEVTGQRPLRTQVAGSKRVGMESVLVIECDALKVLALEFYTDKQPLLTTMIYVEVYPR
jgi:hypothetical protein